MSRASRTIDFEAKANDLIVHADSYHASYYRVPTFGGPSLYFHQRALNAAQGDDMPACLEYIYATLAAWGMHRTGQGGSKMKPFDVFAASIAPLRGALAEARRFDPNAMTEDRWAVVEGIFRSIKVMQTGTSLVGNSKVMAHLLPNIVPPIDREYTLRFVQGNTGITNDLAWEWQLMRAIIERLFMPVAADRTFAALAAGWMCEPQRYEWDTSVFKVIDNLIISAMQQRRISAAGLES